MGAPPIPDNINTGQGVDGFGIGYFSRHIPLSKGGGVRPTGPYLLSPVTGNQLISPVTGATLRRAS